MIKLDVMGVSMDSHHQPVVLLRHEDRVLPIVVGMFEAEAIHAGLVNKDYGRPMTHDLIRNFLAGLRGTVQSVTIYKLENETFYAHVNIEQKSAAGQVEQVLRVDSRPSDGIAIAVPYGCAHLCDAGRDGRRVAGHFDPRRQRRERRQRRPGVRFVTA